MFVVFRPCRAIYSCVFDHVFKTEMAFLSRILLGVFIAAPFLLVHGESLVEPNRARDLSKLKALFANKR